MARRRAVRLLCWWRWSLLASPASRPVLSPIPPIAHPVEKWRQAYEADLKSDHGWLSVSGLFWLHEGANTFGSGPLNDIVLPAAGPAMPAASNSTPATQSCTSIPASRPCCNGKVVESAEMHPDSNSDQLILGDLTLYVHSSGDRFTIRLRDKNSSLRKDLHRHALVPCRRILSRRREIRPLRQAEANRNPERHGRHASRIDPRLRSLQARRKGPAPRRRVDGTDDSFVFRDLTSGHETYAASRFLDTKIEPDGRRDFGLQPGI